MAISYLAKRDLAKRGVVFATINLSGIITIFLVFSSILKVHLNPLLAGVVVLLLSALVLSTGTLTTKILLFSGRKREIAVLRALGAKKSSVLKICIAESILMGLFGSLLGTLLGMTILLGLRTFTDVSFSRDLVLLAVFLGVSATMTSGIYSAMKYMDPEIGAALRHERW
jgi:ABC-type lipoprotein release transport system permease subunit